MKLISVIITTYNWETALAACIQSLFIQTDLDFEIIIADDGSKAPTTELIQQLQLKSPVKLIHCLHPDNGFRAATIRNKAVMHSNGEYLIFIDGDCIVMSHFIQRQRKFASKNYFVAGNRVLLSQKFTHNVLTRNLFLPAQTLLKFVQWRLQGHINRVIPLIYLPLGKLRILQPKKWQQAMSCNLAVWKADFIAVNGFDQLYAGWGYEDSDLVVRLIHFGIKRKEARFAIPVLHLWHPQNSRKQATQNYQLLMQRLNNPEFIFAIQGLK